MFHLIDVSGDDFLEVELECSLQDRVSGRAQQKLAALALRYGSNGTQMFGKLKTRQNETIKYEDYKELFLVHQM